MIKAVLLQCALLAHIVSAQQAVLFIDPVAKYGVSYADGTRTVGDKWGPGQDTVALKWAWARWKNAGMPLSVFRTRYVGQAVIQDIAWTQEAPGNLKTGFQNTFTFAAAQNMRGWFGGNVTVQLPRGGFEGASSFFYAGNGADHGQVATEFFMDDATWWPPTQTDRRLFESPNAGLESNYGYNESFRVEKMCLMGPDKRDNITRTGLFIRRAGEESWVDHIRSDFFSYGVVVVDGAPFRGGGFSTHQNSVCGFCGIGTALASGKVDVVSCDDTPECVGAHAGYGAQAGGTWTFNLIKVENQVTSGRPDADGVVGSFDGQYNVNIGNVNYTNNPPSIPEAAFKVNPTIGGGANQASYIRAQIKGYKYGTLLKNAVTGTSWTSPGDGAAAAFEHYANGDNLSTGCPTVTKVPGTPPPTSGTWTCGTWGACTNGMQTRTCTCTGGVCNDAAKPVQSQVCGSMAVKWSGGPYTMTSTSCDNLTGKANGITSITLYDFRPSSIGWGRILGTGASGASVQMCLSQHGYTAGYFYLTGPGGSTNRVSDNNAPMVAGQTYAKVTITLPAPINAAALWQTNCGQGGAQLGSCRLVELR